MVTQDSTERVLEKCSQVISYQTFYREPGCYIVGTTIANYFLIPKPMLPTSSNFQLQMDMVHN